MGSLRAKVIKERGRLRGRFEEKETKPTRFKAYMGDGAGNVIVEDAPNYVYIRSSGRGRVERCLCTRVAPRNNLPIIAGYSLEKPDTLQVLDFDDAALEELSGYGYQPRHHQQHELNNTYGGDDVVWVRTQQFLHLLVQVQDPISEYLDIQTGSYVYDNTLFFYGGGETQDMTTYAPGVAGQARMVLISLNASSGVITYTQGAVFATSLPSSMRQSQVPQPPAQSIPLAAVYCPNGMTTVDWDYLTDQRPFLLALSEYLGYHNLLSTGHPDTFPTTVAQGMMIYGDGDGPTLWSGLPASAAYRILTMDSSAEEPEWQAFDWDNHILSCAGADGRHVHSSTGEGGSLVPDETRISGTLGSVLFIGRFGGNNVLAEDNDELFWSWTLFRLHVGGNSPLGKVHVSYDSTEPPILEQETQGSDANLLLRNTGATPAYAGGIYFQFENTTPAIYDGAKVIAGVADDTAGSEDVWLAWYTSGAGSLLERMRLTQGGDLGLGTIAPNLGGEARALTIAASAGAPSYELYLEDDWMGADQIIGIIRWWSGATTACAQGQIDMIQTGWYENQSTMRFWAADDCALCLVAEFDCVGASFLLPVFLTSIKSGATQVAAGAATGELWKTNGHATLPDNVVMIGV